MSSFTPAQDAFRFYNDDGSESTETAIAAQSTNVTINAYTDQTCVLRIRVTETAGKAGSSVVWALQMSKNGGAYATITTSTTNGVQAFNSANLTSGNATTHILTGGSTFQTGLVNETGSTGSFALNASSSTEFLYTVKLVAANLLPADTLDFRLTQGGSTFTYSVTPRITVGSPRRFWVGGTGTWDNSATTHWSAQSGGTAGASVPLSGSNDAYFDANSGGGTVTVAAATIVQCQELNCTGFTGSITGGDASSQVIVSDDLTFAASKTYTGVIFNPRGRSGRTTQNVTSNGSLIGSVTTNGCVSSHTLNLLDNLVAQSFTVSQTATFNTNSHNITCTQFDGSGTTTRTYNLGSSVITFGWTAFAGPLAQLSFNGSGLTLNSGTSQFICSASLLNDSYIDFGGLTIYDFEAGNADAAYLILRGSNTFHNFTMDGASKIKFTDGTTQTATAFVINSAGTFACTMTGTSTGGWTLSQASGTVAAKNTTISYSTATGGANFTAPTTDSNVDGGNNTGWAFAAQQLVTIVQATLKFAGFALGTNAKTMTAFSTATLTWAGRPLGANAKSMLAFSQGLLKFAGFVLTTRIVVHVAMTQALLKFLGFVLPVNAKTMTTINQALLKFAGFPLGANGKTMTAINQALLKFAGFAMTVSSAATTPFSLAALKFAGFALGANARTQTAVSQALLKFAGFALGTNAKSMLAFSKGTLTWAGRALTVNARTQTAISQALLKFVGFALPANAKTMTALSRGTLTLAGGVLPVNARTMTTIARGTLTWAGRTLNANAKSFVVMTTAAIFFAGTPLGVAGLLTIPFGQALLRFSGQALQLTVPGLARLLQLLGVGR